MQQDLKPNFDFFNKVVNEQITNVQESKIDESILQKINTKINEADVFNHQLRSSTATLLNTTIFTALDDLKSKLPHMKLSLMETLLQTNPLGEHFHHFIVELFEIAQSSESLKYTLKFIIDSLFQQEKYHNQITSIFLCYLIGSSNQIFYPDDYVEHADFISQFCSGYISSKRISGQAEDEMWKNVIRYLENETNGTNIANYKSIDSFDKVSFKNSYAVVSTGWALLAHYTEVLTHDGSVLANNTFSDFYKNVVFENIDKCLKEYKISELDYLEYLIRIMAHFLKKTTKNKIIDKKVKTIVVYLLESEFGKRNKDNILHSLTKQFAAGVIQIASFRKSVDDHIDRRGSYNVRTGNHGFQKRDEMDAQNFLNMGYAWVSLIFIHEGIFDLQSLLEEFSKFNNFNGVLLEKLLTHHDAAYTDYLTKLKEEEAESAENALSSTTLLTSSRDEEFPTNEVDQGSSDLTSAPTAKKEGRFESTRQSNNNGILDKMAVKMFPQVLLISAFLKINCFKEATYIMSSFKYLFLSLTDLEDFYSSLFNSYHKELVGQENISIEEKIEKNSYYWLFAGTGNLNAEVSKLSFDEYISVGTAIINNTYNPKTVKAVIDVFNDVLYHYKKHDENGSYDKARETVANCVINELIPGCMFGAESISKHIYILLKYFNTNMRSQIYDIITKKFVRENQQLKEMNTMQQKQIRRFLKIVNVDNLSDQLDQLARLVDINPFVTLESCLNLAESYDMISTLLIKSMKLFSDFSMDVLQYTILKRLKIDRPFFSEEDGLAMPWFSKLCSLITTAFSAHHKFNIYGIFDFCLEKIVAHDYTGVYILDSLMNESTECLYLTDVQDELAIMYAGNEKTKKLALEKVDGIHKYKTHKLSKLLVQQRNAKPAALSIIESLNVITYEIFYDSFQSVNKINNKYDTVIRLQKLLIDVCISHNNQDAFAQAFDVTNIITNPSLQFLSDAWKALLIRNTSRSIQKNILPVLSENKSLVEFFWYHCLTDLTTLAINHMPENQRGGLDINMFSIPEMKGFDNFKEKVYNVEDLQIFLEKCLFKNSILGVAEAIYSAEFIFKVLSQKELTKLLDLVFNNRFISKVVIGISSNESKFFAAFVKRIFMILPSYYNTLDENNLQIFKKDVVRFLESFTIEISDLVLDYEYINCRNAIQILSESIKYLPSIDVYVKILVDAIEKKISDESRKELLAPLNAVIGFSKNKLKECDRLTDFCDEIELNDALKKIDNILQLSKQIIEETSKVEKYNGDLETAEAEENATKDKLHEKKNSIDQTSEPSVPVKRFNDGEDLRKEPKKIKVSYEEDDVEVSKSPTPIEEPVVNPVATSSSRFEGFAGTTTPEPAVVLNLPSQPKSRQANRIQDDLENPDFIKYIESKIRLDIRPPMDFHYKRSFELLEEALTTDPLRLSYLVPTLKYFKQAKVVEILVEILKEKPEYFIPGLLHFCIIIFTYDGLLKFKSTLIELWNRLGLNKIDTTNEKFVMRFRKLDNMKTLNYDNRSQYSFTEQIDILMQFLKRMGEGHLSEQFVFGAFTRKSYPESAFAKVMEKQSSRFDDRIRSRESRFREEAINANREERRSNAAYDRAFNNQNRRTQSENRFSRRQSDRNYSYRDSRRY